MIINIIKIKTNIIIIMITIYKGGYNDYDYDYGKSYKKKSYYKGGYK